MSSSDDDDFLSSMFDDDPLPGEKESAYDVAYEAFSAYVDFIKPASHTHSRVTNYQGKLVCTVVDIFNKTHQNDFIDAIVKYAYNSDCRDGDPVFYCAVIDYVANILHGKRDKVDDSPPKKCGALVEAYRNQVEVGKKLEASSKPTDPRLAKIIPGVVRVAPPSTFVPNKPKPVAAKPKAASPPKKESIVVPASTEIPMKPSSNPVAPPAPKPKPTTQPTPSRTEVSDSSKDHTRKSSFSKHPERQQSSTPSSSTAPSQSLVEPTTPSNGSSSSALKRPSTSERPSSLKQRRPTEELPSRVTFDYNNDNWDTLEMFNNRPEFRQVLHSLVYSDEPIDVKPTDLIKARDFCSIDSCHVRPWPDAISSAEWKQKGEEYRNGAVSKYQTELLPFDQQKENWLRVYVALISDFALARKRDFLEKCGKFNIDYPYHWSTLNETLKWVPSANRLIKSFVICVGLEFCTRFDDYGTAKTELVNFYDDFFKMYKDSFAKSYKVHQKEVGGVIPVTSFPPTILILTVPLILNGEKFPIENVKRLNDRIRKIVAERKAADTERQYPIEFYDWANATSDVTQFTEENVQKRFMRLCVALNEYNFFDQLKRTTDNQ
uniref:AAA domain-containing protein n=1 Tax=Panagrellus redivivus TaxID=6233 RepID=A0A7E4VCT9_PANRE